jgi:hypothetical protein
MCQIYTLGFKIFFYVFSALAFSLVSYSAIILYKMGRGIMSLDQFIILGLITYIILVNV